MLGHLGKRGGKLHHLCPPPPLLLIDTEHSEDSDPGDFGIRCPRLSQGSLEGTRGRRTVADDQVVGLPRSDVLQGEDGPVPVLLAPSDRGNLLAGFSQGQHPATFVSAESEAVVVRVQGAGAARVSWLGTGTQRGGEVQPQVDSVAHLLGGALGQVELVLVVGKHVVQRGILVLLGAKRVPRNLK